MIRLIYGADEQIAQWTLERIRECGQFTLPRAIGIADDNGLIAGVVYHGFTGLNCEMSIAAESPRWASRGRLFFLFAYPFEQLGCQRVTAITARANKRSRDMLERLGFKLEGVARCAMPKNKDAMIYGMVRDECKWLENR